MNINWSESKNSVQNGQKWPNLIAVYNSLWITLQVITTWN